MFWYQMYPIVSSYVHIRLLPWFHLSYHHYIALELKLLYYLRMNMIWWDYRTWVLSVSSIQCIYQSIVYLEYHLQSSSDNNWIIWTSLWNGYHWIELASIESITTSYLLARCNIQCVYDSSFHLLRYTFLHIHLQYNQCTPMIPTIARPTIRLQQWITSTVSGRAIKEQGTHFRCFHFWQELAVTCSCIFSKTR